jgi:predicted MPP superfamily phosphohydrolase
MYFFFASVILAIIIFLNSHFGFSIPLNLIGKLLFAFVLTLVGYGIINASSPRIVNLNIESSALSPQWKGKKIVLFSDVHLGMIRGKTFMKRIVNIVNAQNPDLVLIAGDIIDGPVFDYEKGLSPLAELKSTFGVFYTPGNHEGYNIEQDKFYSVIKKLTTSVIDEKFIVNGTQIIGMNYKPRENDQQILNVLEKINFDKDLPSIAMLHEPTEARFMQEQGVNLVLSGHTHYGQFFPINLIVHAMYHEYAYGVNTTQNSTAITTCGVGTAMTPIRIGTNSEIVVININ